MHPLFNSKVMAYFISPPLWFCVYLFTPISERNALVNGTNKDYLEDFPGFVDVIREGGRERGGEMRRERKGEEGKTGGYRLCICEFSSAFVGGVSQIPYPHISESVNGEAVNGEGCLYL